MKKNIALPLENIKNFMYHIYKQTYFRQEFEKWGSFRETSFCSLTFYSYS